MNFKVKTISVFEHQAKRLIKKFPSLKSELETLIFELKEEPAKGIPIGHDCYKIRIAISSKGRGKSAGARIITHLVYKNNTVYLLSIYNKSDLANLSEKEILERIKEIP